MGWGGGAAAAVAVDDDAAHVTYIHILCILYHILDVMKWTLMPPEIAILRGNKVELMEMLRVIVVG